MWTRAPGQSNQNTSLAVLCTPWQKDALLLLWLCYVVAVRLKLPVGRPCSCIDHKEQGGLSQGIGER